MSRKTSFEDSLDGELLWHEQGRSLFFRLKIPFLHYYITSESLVIRSGFLKEHMETVQLYRVVDVSLERGLFQRLFNLGTIIIQAYDYSSNGILRLKNVVNPLETRKILAKAIARSKSNSGLTTREFLDNTSLDGDYFN